MRVRLQEGTLDEVVEGFTEVPAVMSGGFLSIWLLWSAPDKFVPVICPNFLSWRAVDQ